MYLQIAIENAINFDVCQAKTGAAKLACEMDKATVNIGALFSKQVEGRISTEVRMPCLQLTDHTSMLIFDIQANCRPCVCRWIQGLHMIQVSLCH